MRVSETYLQLKACVGGSSPLWRQAFFIDMSNYKFEFTKNTYSKGYRKLLIYAGFNEAHCLSKDYQTHHLDHNRDNNHFTNLVLLDKKFHRKYHTNCNHWYFKLKDIENPHLITEYELEFLYWEILQKSGEDYHQYIEEDYEKLKKEFIPAVRQIRELYKYQHSQIAKAILKIK